MCAGIAGARHDSASELPEDVITRLDTMVSKDGEVVPFKQPIHVRKQMSVKGWLKTLGDACSRHWLYFLNRLFLKTRPHSQELTTSGEGKKVFVEWATKFLAQVMILATLANRSMAVS
jgi:hypothetical protein